MKDLSPSLNTLKKNYNDYVFNLQNEYQQKIQKLLEEGEVEVKQGKQKNWDSSLLKYNTVLNQIKKQKTDALRPLKETIREQKKQISQLKSASAKTKRQKLIEQAEQEIKKAEQNFNNMSEKVTELFQERNNLIKTTTKSTQAEMDKINEKIKNNSETITKVVLGGWTALSFLANYYMWQLTGLGL